MKKMWMTRDASREPILITKEELAQENLEILKIVEIKEQDVMIGHMYCGTSYVLENGEIAFDWGEGNLAINTDGRNNPYDVDCDYEIVSLILEGETYDEAEVRGLVKIGLFYFDKDIQDRRLKKYTMIDEQLTDNEIEELIRIEIEKNK